MADHDIKIAGAVYPDVPAVELPINGGGTATYVEVSDTTATDSDVASGKIYYKADGSQSTGTSSGGGGSYPWFGPNTVYVGRAYSQTINLKNDTTFDSWTASNTATTIKAASTTADWTQTCDYNNAWFFVVRAYVDVAFLAGATMKNTVRRSVIHYVQVYYPYMNSKNALENNTCNAFSNAINGVSSGTRYYTSTENSLSYVANVSYGPMNIGSPISFTMSGATVGGKRGAISARCNNTYFATARKAEVDSANTNMIYTVDVYKTPVPNAIGSWMVDNLHTDMTSGL